MKKLIFFCFYGLFSCSDYIDKPKNLVDQNVMAEVIADLVINDQANCIRTGIWKQGQDLF
jgi:hypothetical protein